MGNAQPPHCEDKYPDIPDEYLWLATPVLFGFSFATKQWGAFDITYVDNIQFDKDAFDQLVMQPDKKAMIKGLVSQYSNDNAQGTNDIIKNKGIGCIFLCYGSPGTGKTLTAESIAEYLERPLWIASQAELGITPKTLEKNLSRLLQLSQGWQAIVLFDEADVYLEQRDVHNIHRSAIVAVFLRKLEYFPGKSLYSLFECFSSRIFDGNCYYVRLGIIFLTTNRVANFDQAMCSRISVFLKFPDLEATDREKIWRHFIRQYNINCEIESRLHEEEANYFAKSKLNGREIRNIMQVTSMWAKSSKEPLNRARIEKAIAMTIEGLDSMRNASQEKSSLPRGSKRRWDGEDNADI